MVNDLFWMFQGIDLKAGGRKKNTQRTAPKSENVYLLLLVKVGFALCFQFLYRRIFFILPRCEIAAL